VWFAESVAEVVSRHEAEDHARRIADSWRLHGVHKWMAYDRETDEVVGRGGLSCTVRHNVRSRAVMERVGMRYAGEIRSRGTVEGETGARDDAPFAVCVMLRADTET
jgi:RimJ/RimL family protein N-acetyltransferase